MLGVRIAGAAEIDHAQACELDEVADAAGLHGFADEVGIGVLALLALPHRLFDCGRREFERERMIGMGRGDDEGFTAGEVVGDLAAAVVGMVALHVDGAKAREDLRKGDLTG